MHTTPRIEKFVASSSWGRGHFELVSLAAALVTSACVTGTVADDPGGFGGGSPIGVGAGGGHTVIGSGGASITAGSAPSFGGSLASGGAPGTGGSVSIAGSTNSSGGSTSSGALALRRVARTPVARRAVAPSPPGRKADITRQATRSRTWEACTSPSTITMAWIPP